MKCYLNIFIFLMAAASPAMAKVHQTAWEYMEDGNNDFRNNNLTQAISDYSKAILISPHLAKAYNNRGVSYAEVGSMQRAVDDFTMAIVLDPKNAEAYNNRGHAYAVQNDYVKAVSDFTMAVQINPLYLKATVNRAMAYYYLHDYEKAWRDVFKIEELGGKVNARLYQALKNAEKGKDL